MAKIKKLNDAEQVAEYFQELDHPLKAVVQTLRSIILAADPEIGERIKWNSPSFYYTGEMAAFDPKEYKRDLVVLNLHKPDQVLLVFPTGAQINDPTGILGGNFPDGRKTVKVLSLEDAKEKELNLQKVIKLWLTAVPR